MRFCATRFSGPYARNHTCNPHLRHWLTKLGLIFRIICPVLEDMMFVESSTLVVVVVSLVSFATESVSQAAHSLSLSCRLEMLRLCSQPCNGHGDNYKHMAISADSRTS